MPLPRLRPDERPWLITRIANRVACALNRFFDTAAAVVVWGTVLLSLFSEDARAVALYLAWHAAKLVVAGALVTLAEP